MRFSMTRLFSFLASGTLAFGMLTTCALPYFASDTDDASRIPTSSTMTKEQIRNIFLNEGIDEKLIDAAMSAPTRTSNNIADYVATYYVKSIAINETLHIYARTYSGSDAALAPNATGTCVHNWVLLSNTNESTTNMIGGTMHNFDCKVTPDSTQIPLFDVCFSNTGYSGTGAPISVHANSCLFVGAGNNPSYENWNDYMNCKTLGLGDVNLDGTINIDDALYATYIKEEDPLMVYSDELKQRRAANVDGYNGVTSTDITMILQYLANMRTSFLS